MTADLVCALLLFIGNIGHLAVLTYKVLKFTELEVPCLPCGRSLKLPQGACKLSLARLSQQPALARICVSCHLLMAFRDRFRMTTSTRPTLLEL